MVDEYRKYWASQSKKNKTYELADIIPSDLENGTKENDRTLSLPDDKLEPIHEHFFWVEAFRAYMDAKATQNPQLPAAPTPQAQGRRRLALSSEGSPEHCTLAAIILLILVLGGFILRRFLK